MSPNEHVAEVVVALYGWGVLLLEGILVLICAKNRRISKWMPLAMFGSILTLAGWFGQQIYPWLYPSGTGESMTEYLAFIFLLHFIGIGFFLAGLTGTFAEFQQKLLAAAMLDKPPTSDEIH